MRKKLLLALLIVLTATGLLFAQGQGEAADGEFTPQQDVDWYCTSSPGGGSDIFTRTISDIIKDKGLVEEDFAITYKTDGAGEVGRLEVSRKRAGRIADHTLLTFNSGDLMPMVKNTERRISDFTPLALMAIDKHLIFIGEESEYETFEEVIEAAKSGEEVVMAGSKGDDIGCYEGLIEEIGLTKDQLSYITNDSSSEAITSILGGHVDIVISKPAAASEYVEAGKLTPILAVATERFPGNLSSAPTLSEVGNYENVEVPNWRSVVGPKDMSPEAAQFWSDVLKEVSESEAWRNGYIEQFKLIPQYIGYGEIAQWMKDFQDDYLATLN